MIKQLNRKAERKRAESPLLFACNCTTRAKKHFDLRLEHNGVLLSWAVPKGVSYSPRDKRLAIMVEDHPISYKDFEGTIPKGEYGGGTVMLWDAGTYEPIEDIATGLKKGSLKFRLFGKKLKGAWALVKMEDNQWLLIKEKDEFIGLPQPQDISVKSGRTMDEIAAGIPSKNPTKKDGNNICGVQISSPDKVLFPSKNITKLEVAKYYQQVASRMLPYMAGRVLSVVRCNKGINGECFFKKHPIKILDGIGTIALKNKEGESSTYFYIKNSSGLIGQVQLGTVEFHAWGSTVETLENPDLMVFDLDPDKGLSLDKVRQGARDLKLVLSELGLKSYLKTSGGKGYHVVVRIVSQDWESFHDFAKSVAVTMEARWPSRYTANIRKEKRKGKIFIDWARNGRGSTSVAPYSLRARPGAPVSCPIEWRELDTIAPADIDMRAALSRLSLPDPWKTLLRKPF